MLDSASDSGVGSRRLRITLRRVGSSGNDGLSPVARHEAGSYDQRVPAPASEPLLELAERAGLGISSLGSKEHLKVLDDHSDELLAELQRFLDEGRTDDALRLATSLARFWMATGRLDEGREWFDRVLAAPGPDAISRGRGCVEAGLFAFWLGQNDDAAAYHREALEIGRRVGDPTVTALALTGLARIALRARDIDEGRRLCREALTATEGTADRDGRSSATHVLAAAEQMAGNFQTARELMVQRMVMARELGNYAAVAVEASNLSMVERQLGHLDEAEALAREALQIARQRGDEWMIPYVLNGLAAIALERQAFKRAATLIGAAEAIMDTQHASWPPDERPHYEKTVSRLAQEMGVKQFELARAAGHALPMGEALDLARSG
jgi:tetratricopeptide (TPR) repeat protein